MATPIERRKVYELVAEQLVSRIHARELLAGDALPPERELMQQYGVGRSSVREALRMLESRGLIRGRGNGAFVVAPAGNPLGQGLRALLAANEGDLRQLFEVRWVLEGAVATMAADVRTETSFIAADIDFHLAVAAATGNRVLAHLMHAIRDQLRSAFGTVYRIPGSPERSVAQHRAIAAAIRELRPDEARALMREHIARVEQEFVDTAAGAAAG